MGDFRPFLIPFFSYFLLLMHFCHLSCILLVAIVTRIFAPSILPVDTTPPLEKAFLFFECPLTVPYFRFFQSMTGGCFFVANFLHSLWFRTHCVTLWHHCANLWHVFVTSLRRDRYRTRYRVRNIVEAELDNRAIFL